jgi:hypothetical protein
LKTILNRKILNYTYTLQIQKKYYQTRYFLNQIKKICSSAR